MSFMLDTDTCIHIIKHRPTALQTKLGKISVGEIAVSSVVVAELAYGIEHSARKSHNRQALDEFLGHIVLEDWPTEAAWEYGRIRSHLRRKGTPIGAMDLLIAAHALYAGATLVTGNTREFRRVPRLTVENWIQS